MTFWEKLTQGIVLESYFAELLIAAACGAIAAIVHNILRGKHPRSILTLLQQRSSKKSVS